MWWCAQLLLMCLYIPIENVHYLSPLELFRALQKYDSCQGMYCTSKWSSFLFVKNVHSWWSPKLSTSCYYSSRKYIVDYDYNTFGLINTQNCFPQDFVFLQRVEPWEEEVCRLTILDWSLKYHNIIYHICIHVVILCAINIICTSQDCYTYNYYVIKHGFIHRTCNLTWDIIEGTPHIYSGIPMFSTHADIGKAFPHKRWKIGVQGHAWIAITLNNRAILGIAEIIIWFKCHSMWLESHVHIRCNVFWMFYAKWIGWSLPTGNNNLQTCTWSCVMCTSACFELS